METTFSREHPPKMVEQNLCCAFSTFGWVLNQFWNLVSFTLYFTKGGQKKVRRHFQRFTIGYEKCSSTPQGHWKRIQLGMMNSVHFGQFCLTLLTTTVSPPCVFQPSSTDNFSYKTLYTLTCTCTLLSGTRQINIPICPNNATYIEFRQ